MITTSGYTTKKQIKRLQDLSRLLDLKSFKFIYCYQMHNSTEWAYSYSIDINDYKRLNEILKEDYRGIKKPTVWQKFSKYFR